MSAAELYNHLYPAADPTIHQDRLFQVYFQIFSTVCLKLAATNSSDQRLRLFLNLDLKQFYSLRLSLNTDLTCRQRLSSYHRVIIIIIISYKISDAWQVHVDEWRKNNNNRISIAPYGGNLRGAGGSVQWKPEWTEQF